MLKSEVNMQAFNNQSIQGYRLVPYIYKQLPLLALKKESNQRVFMLNIYIEQKISSEISKSLVLTVEERR